MYWGLPGTGKTLCLVDDAIQDMLTSLLRTYNSYDNVDYLNTQGFHFSKKFKHLSFSNIDINTLNTGVPNLKIYKVNPYRLGMPNKKFKTDIFPGGSTFYITEFQNYCDSNMYQYLRPEVKQFYQTYRQAGVNFCVDCQRPTDISKSIRDLCDTFVENISCEELIKDGYVVGHKIKQRIIYSPRILEQYLKNNDERLCEEQTRIILGCRYQNFNSYFCKMLHLKGRESQDYKVIYFGEEDDSDILTIPVGYYEKRSENAQKDNKGNGVIFYD